MPTKKISSHYTLALGDDTITDCIVVKLYVAINNFFYSFSANFYITANTSNYFDLLIGMKTNNH